MQRHLEILRSKLSSAVTKSWPSDGLVGRPELIAEAFERVRKTFNERTNAKPSEDRLANAITAFLRNKSISDSRQAGLISWGLATSHDTKHQPLLELETVFPQFMNATRGFWNGRELSTKAWRGLLSSYFGYPGSFTKNDVGRANWFMLRDFLKNSFPALLQRQSHRPPDWMFVLQEHQTLLGNDPCKPYAELALTGSMDPVKDLRERLGLPEASWVFAEFIRVQVQLACSVGDHDFKEHIPRVCQHLREYKVYLDEGMKEILTRYSQCSDTSEHSELARLLIDDWGNPKLPSSTRWGLVTPEIKRMVIKWLINKDLHLFFDLFSKSHGLDQDKRRFEFWSRYLDQIHDAYFALGGQAYFSQQEDFCELRRRNQGRTAKLEGSTQLNNNAFIMLIGKYAIVEFGTTGNACFCFDLEDLPFKLGDPCLYNHTYGQGLKNKSHSGCRFRKIHSDKTAEKWEEVFELELQNLGISPDSPGDVSRSSSTRGRRLIRRTSSFWSENVNSVLKGFNMWELQRLARKYGLAIADLRYKGGNLWVTPDVPNSDVHKKLSEWGFQLKRDKGWWLK